MIQKTGNELLVAIETEEQVWVRLGTILPDHQEEWALIVLDITAGEAPPNWEAIYWPYSRAILWAGMLPGASVADWLRAQAITIGDHTIAVPALQTNQPLPVRRHSSGGLGVHGRFHWPYEEWTIQLSVTNGASLSDELIGEGAVPSFIRPDIAFAAMLHADPSPGGAFDARSLIFRKQIQTARIRGVHVLPTKVEVELDGDDLPGSTVELASNQRGPVQIIADNGQQTVELPTPTGLPPVPWIVVKRGGECPDMTRSMPGEARCISRSR